MSEVVEGQDALMKPLESNNWFHPKTSSVQSEDSLETEASLDLFGWRCGEKRGTDVTMDKK